MTTQPESPEWALPADPTPRLDMGELLLIDWIICGSSRLLPNADLDYLVKSWHTFRLQVWKTLDEFTDPAITERPFIIGIPEAKALFALAPTTFRWGTGSDCGFSLKQKLSRYLATEE